MFNLNLREAIAIVGFGLFLFFSYGLFSSEWLFDKLIQLINLQF